ncbi:MAG: hypothetical protein HY721_35620 [Planctomycetes bacterium]|nr:hypothetical protein [Planctomycetota bacterium]
MPSLPVAPRPEGICEGDAFVLVAQGPSLVAIPLPPQPGPVGQALTEAEERTLAEGGFHPARAAPAPDALRRTAQEYYSLLTQSLDVPAAARLLGVNASRIRQRVGGRPPSLYGIKLNREWRLPRFQFHGKGTVPGIEAAIRELDPEAHPLAVVRWFITPHQDLLQEDRPSGRHKTFHAAALSPVDWLLEGRSASVLAALAAQI